MGSPFFKDFKERNSVCGIFEGAQKPDEKPGSIL
jgi:hypothetical protein